MVYVSPIPEYILGIDVLWGLWLQTTVEEFRLRVRVVKANLQGHPEHTPVQLPSPGWVMAVKQYWLPRGHGPSWSQPAIHTAVAIQQLQRHNLV